MHETAQACICTGQTPTGIAYLAAEREDGEGSGRLLLQPYVRRVAAHRRDQRLNTPLCVLCVCVCVCVCDCKSTYIRI